MPDLKTSPEVRFADQIGLVYERAGLPRIAGRALGWMLVCEPEHQSLGDLTAALDISKASASTSLRVLESSGFIERVPSPGDGSTRRDYFRVCDDAWSKFFRSRVAVISGLRTLAEHGLKSLSNAPASRRARLERMLRLYAFIERELPQMVQRFEDEEVKRGN
jgi:DNA-binding transcriptional regulator GbsR (MarR family)